MTVVDTSPRLPIGKRKGERVSHQPTGYLLWWLATSSLREQFPTTAAAVLTELRQRFNDANRAESELLPDYCDLI